MTMYSHARNQRGFTVAELVVVLSIIAIVISVAVPKFSAIKGQMRSSEDLRQLSGDLADLRVEAIRLRSNIQIAFSASGYSWDIGVDGSVDGSRTLGKGSAWSGSTPSTILINGLGLARGIASQQTISIRNKGFVVSLTINRNGHIQLL